MVLMHYMCAHTEHFDKLFLELRPMTERTTMNSDLKSHAAENTEAFIDSNIA